MGLSASEKARLLKDIELRVAKAKERRRMRDMKQKDKGSQEKGNAAEVKEEVERQLAAVKDKAEKDAIAAGFSCEVVDSEEEALAAVLLWHSASPGREEATATLLRAIRFPLLALTQ